MADRHDKDLPMMSVTKEMVQLGMQHPTDLLSAMLDYTEQAAAPPPVGLPLVSPSKEPREARHRSETESELSLSPNSKHLIRSRSESEPVQVRLDQSKWKPTVSAVKCAGPKCRKRFSSVLGRRRNCSMCGEVFCRRCTNYRRKLSVSARPDPLGTFFQVCEVCFNTDTAFGSFRDLMREFSTHRRNTVERKKSEADTQLRNPYCVRTSSVGKRAAMEEEMQKLIKGYKENSGWMRGILSELKAPGWQKLPQWVEPSKASHCFSCDSQFGSFSRKVNCRIGGQVFCSACCKDEIVLYSSEGEIKWAVNGKPGGPSTTPSSYKLLPVCCSCSSDLQIAVLERVQGHTTVSSPTSFLDKLHRMHQSLSKLEAKIETSLPEYLTIVDTLDVADNSPKSIDGRSPLQCLVKVQSDLSDAFSSLAVQSQKLKTLKPETDAETRLHRHAMIGTYQYYSENMFQFRLTKIRLGELMPTDHLEEIQRTVSQRSMERVHLIIQQLVYEALNLEKRLKLSDDFFNPIMAIVHSIEEEFKPFMDKQNESWKKHTECSMEFIEREIREGRKVIKLDKEVRDSASMRYIIISQSSSSIHNCYRELQAKTVDREFRKTKESMYNAFSKLDTLLIRANFS